MLVISSILNIGIFTVKKLIGYGFSYLGYDKTEVYISDLSVDLDDGFAIDLKINTNLTSPLTVSLHDIEISMKYKDNDKEFDFANLKADKLNIEIFKTVIFETKVQLKQIDSIKAHAESINILSILFKSFGVYANRVIQ